ncbi:hypothetical protein CANARDRAFT_5783 [[Candida] arabinofermentans NRRL YB-2248]|uniref:Mid2 domain-containing protein n=1 Tax=[Candida] arabinofermentans NRRL YB-2248 TaxID=983967 RepID=A0A1E4T642_9ASCO|nr:hypothetical protein CANARDRAFT_5783 [[Candida] arabinofermentans NRRL YB-2248]
MKITNLLSFISISSTIYAAGLPKAAIEIIKRDNNQNVLSDGVWTSTSSGKNVLITPTAIDGVTISASPITSSATPWVSLDSSGIPYAVTPSISDGTTVSASPTPTDSSYPDPTGGAPPVLRCMNDRVPDEDATESPFCIQNGTEFVVGETYWITWDPTYWGGDIDRVRIQTEAYPLEDDDDALFTSSYINNNNGYFAWFIKSSYKKNSGYFWLNITPLVTSTSDATHTGTASGPLCRIIDSVSDSYAGANSISRVPSDNGVETVTSKSSDSSSKVKIIVPAVVVPVVVIGLLIFGIFFYFQKVKNSNTGKTGFFSSIKLSSSGYFGSRAERTGRNENVAADNDNASVVTDDLRSEYSNDQGTIITASTGHNANPFI